MKNFTKLFAVVVVIILGFSANTFGQVDATATSSATIVTPITISKTTDLNFGNIAVSDQDGTVILAASSAGTRTPSGGVTLPANTGTVTAAKFHVTGESGYTYSIGLPGSFDLSDGNGHTMPIGTFTSNPTPTGTLVSGADDFYVGALLTVTGLQAAGTYTNTTGLTVTVNYN